MKEYKYLIIHCSATPELREVRPADIIRMHTAPAPAGRGWKTVGYSRFITLDGEVHALLAYDEDKWIEANEITNGAAGYNSVSRHICYAGGMSKDMKAAKDTRTPAQTAALTEYVKEQIRLHPAIKVLGHNQVSSKACPSFSVPQFLKSIGVHERNIFKA